MSLNLQTLSCTPTFPPAFSCPLQKSSSEKGWRAGTFPCNPADEHTIELEAEEAAAAVVLLDLQKKSEVLVKNMDVAMVVV